MEAAVRANGRKYSKNEANGKRRKDESENEQDSVSSVKGKNK